MNTSAVALTPVEAAALVDLPEGKVRKEVEHGLLGTTSPPRVAFPALVYLRSLRLLGLELGVDDRKKLLTKILEALSAKTTPEVLELTSIVQVRLGPVVKELAAKIDAFERWKKRLVVKDEILGGEPVFPSSRLAVRQVGSLAERGESTEAILEDYPYLKPQDVEFAKLYARAYPRPGRPRESRSTST